MKVILLQDVKNLGKKNQVVEVSEGYFRNFLSKNKLAVLASKTANQHLEKDLAELQKIEDTNVANAIKLKAQLEAVTLNFKLKSNNGKAFGSVSQKQIIDLLKEQNIIITKYMFSDDFQPLKVGNVHIELNVYKTINAKLHIIVTD